MKNRWKALGGAVLAMALIAAPLTAANATGWHHPHPDPECTPKAAWTETIVDAPAVPAVPAIPAIPAIPAVAEIPEVSHTDYQRYSWTGGPIYGAPTSTPPGDDWQANTTNYEGAGHGTDPIGVAFDVSNEHSGKADWFFWTATKVIDQEYVPGTPEVPGVPEVPGTPAIPAQTHDVFHPAVTCEPPGDEIVPPTVDITVDCDAIKEVHVTAVNPNDENVEVEAYFDFDGDSLPDANETLTIVPGVTDLFYDFAEDVAVGIAVRFDGEIIFAEVVTVDCYPPEEPPVVIPTPALFSAPVTPPDCDTAGAFNFSTDPTPNLDVTVDPEYDGPGTYTVTATALNGATFSDGSTVKTRTVEVLGAIGFQSTDPEVACYQAPTPQLIQPAPLSPEFLDTCGPDVNYLVPGNTDSHTYEVVEDGNTVTITAVLRNPDRDDFPADAVTEWTYTFTDVACPAGTTPPATVGTPTSPTGTLAATGLGGNLAPWAIGSLAMMLAGISALAFRRVARR